MLLSDSWSGGGYWNDCYGQSMRCLWPGLHQGYGQFVSCKSDSELGKWTLRHHKGRPWKAMSPEGLEEA